MSTGHALDITIMGREYRIACPPDKVDTLRAVAARVDAEMSAIASKTHNAIPERVAVMAALNLAEALLNETQVARLPDSPPLFTSPPSPDLFDTEGLEARIRALSEQIEASLQAEDTHL